MNKHNIGIWLLLLLPLRLLGQQDVITLTAPVPANGATIYEAKQTIYLNPSFSYTAVGSSTFTARIVAAPPPPPPPPEPPVHDVSPEKQTQNYILTHTFTNDAATTCLDNIRYFDGLGRLEETVQKEITPAKADLVTYQEYDTFGRESRSWLPAVASNNNGDYLTPAAYKTKATDTYNSAAYNVAADANPFSLPVYEASPLNRVVNRFGPGADWQNNDKGVATGYLTNGSKPGVAWTNADSLVCGQYFSTGDKKTVGLYRTDNYEAGVLYVTRTKDEDGNIDYEFKDKLGQVVLTRRINANQSFDTNYIYDDFGNLRAVLPPEASARLLSATATAAWTETNDDLSRYAYLYKYDDRNRCIAEKLPGCDWICFIYDGADRLIFTQDGENRKAGLWLYSIPDAFGRTVLTGVCRNTFTYTANPLGATTVKGAYNSSRTSLQDSYTITGVSLTDPSILTACFYDNYAFMGIPEAPDTMDTQYNTENGYGARYTGGCQGMLTGTVTALIDLSGMIPCVHWAGDMIIPGHKNPDGSVSAPYLYSIMYYDNRNRLIQTKSNNSLQGGLEKEYIAYDFAGQPTGRKHIHSATGKATQTEVYAYQYDHAERLTKETHQLNGGTVTTIAENTYDELGRLKTNKKGGLAGLNTTNTYTIRSWINSISSPDFSEYVFYNSTGYGGCTKHYNGNLSAMYVTMSGEPNQRGYVFSYDNLSRLTAASYIENGIANASQKTAYSYDNQGNIQTLQRYGKTDAANYGLIDDLTMTYSGNQLTKVEDAAPDILISESMDFKNYSNTPTEYTYNANGAMTQDLNKGITNIQYNLLNLPQQMDIKNPVTEGSNEYTYSADGKKLQAVYGMNMTMSVIPIGGGSGYTTTTFSISKTTDYINNMIYESGALDQNSTLKRILIDGGYIEGGVYYYYLTDHQGNNRMVVRSDGVVIQKNNYYPFGMVFAESYVTVDEQDLQPYKYNGKELDRMHGLNQYDYSARYYDPALCRFTTVDPMAEKYYGVSPYVYCLNNPVRYVDTNGKDITIYYITGYDQWGQATFNHWTFNGANQSKAPSNSFVQDFITAYNYNVKNGDRLGNGGGENIKTFANSRNMTASLIDATGFMGADNKRDPSSGFIFWDSRLASKTEEGYVESPATILEHEMDHALDYLRNPKAHQDRVDTPDKQYKNAEERRVTTGSEAKTGYANGEYPKGYSRSDRKDYGDIRVSDPTQTTPIQIPQQEQIKSPTLWDSFLQRLNDLF